MGHPPPPRERATIKGAQLLHRACDILDLVARSEAGIDHAAMMRESGLTRATLYRILAVLAERRLVRHKPASGTYVLGSALVELLHKGSSDSALFRIAEPELIRLRDMTGETAYLAVREGAEMVGIGKLEGPHSVRSAARLGARKPLYCTSQGKAVLAAMPEADREAILRRVQFAALTPRSITERQRLEAELRITRARGFAIDDEEIMLGIRCVGAAVVDVEGQVLGAISIAGPAFRLSRERLHALGPELAAVGQLIGAQCRPATPQPRADDFNTYACTPLTPEAPPAFCGLPPRYDAASGRLWYADGLAPKLRCIDERGSDLAVMAFDDALAGIEILAPGSLTVVTRHGLLIDLDAGGVPTARRMMAMPPGRTIRATATHRQARLVVSLLSEDLATSTVGVVEPDGAFTALFRVSGEVTALCCSLDGRVIHAANGAGGTIHRWLDGEESPRLLIRLAQGSGQPSALATDRDGRLWVALRNGWAVARLNDIGEIDLLVPVPIPAPSGIAFGGGDRQYLLIATSRLDVPFDALAAAPLSGLLLRIDLPAHA